ncbi:MAG: glycosyltransferase family 39 protein [Candidatus Odinarchaeota archaeon]
MNVLKKSWLESLRKKQNLELMIILIISFASHLVLSSLYHGPVDFLIHYDAAKQISEGKVLYLTVTAHQTAEGVTFPYPDYPPVYLYMMGMIFALTGSSIFVMKAVLCFFNIACALMLYIICNGLRMTHRQALLAVAVFSFHPASFTMTVVGYFDYLPVLFLLLMVYFLHVRNPTKQNNRDHQLNALMSGIAVGLGTMTKLFPALALVIVLPWLLVQKRIKEALIFLLAATSIVFLISLPFLLLIPEEFIYHVFSHVNAIRPNLSVYYYLFPFLYNTAVLLIIQAIFILFIGFIVATATSYNVRIEKIIPSCYFLLIGGFLFLNRINYPHYAAWFIPFIVLLMVESWGKNKLRLIILVSLQAVSSFGGLLWSISWVNDPTYAESIPVLELSGFLLFNLCLLILLLEEAHHLKKLLVSERAKYQ